MSLSVDMNIIRTVKLLPPVIVVIPIFVALLRGGKPLVCSYW